MPQHLPSQQAPRTAKVQGTGPWGTALSRKGQPQTLPQDRQHSSPTLVQAHLSGTESWPFLKDPTPLDTKGT